MNGCLSAGATMKDWRTSAERGLEAQRADRDGGDEGERHAEEEGRIDARAARDGEVDRAAALGGIGDHEAADDEEQLDAEISVFREPLQVRQRRRGIAVGRRAAEAVVEENHRQHREHAQEIEDLDAAAAFAGRGWTRNSHAVALARRGMRAP
jgi:hypothetical protein